MIYVTALQWNEAQLLQSVEEELVLPLLDCILKDVLQQIGTTSITPTVTEVVVSSSPVQIIYLHPPSKPPP